MAGPMSMSIDERIKEILCEEFGTSLIEAALKTHKQSHEAQQHRASNSKQQLNAQKTQSGVMKNTSRGTIADRYKFTNKQKSNSVHHPEPFKACQQYLVSFPNSTQKHSRNASQISADILSAAEALYQLANAEHKMNELAPCNTEDLNKLGLNWIKASANCIYNVTEINNEKVFTKVQVSDRADSLLTEAIITQILTKINSDLFPIYKRHFLGTFTDVEPIKQSTKILNLEKNIPLQCMSLQAINGKSFAAELQTAYSKRSTERHLLDSAGSYLAKMLLDYVMIGIPICMTHNDLHFNNMMFHHTQTQQNMNKFHLKIIDFGRAYIDFTKVNALDNPNNNTLSPLMELVKTSFEKYDVQSPPEDPTKLQKLCASGFQIINEKCNTLYDLATVSVNFLPIVLRFDPGKWPNFCKFSKSPQNEIMLEISLEELGKFFINFFKFWQSNNVDEERRTITVYILGLAWFVITVYALQYTEHGVNPRTTLKFKFELLRKYSLMMPNGMYMPNFVKKYHSFAVLLFQTFVLTPLGLNHDNWHTKLNDTIIWHPTQFPVQQAAQQIGGTNNKKEDDDKEEAEVNAWIEQCGIGAHEMMLELLKPENLYEVNVPKLLNTTPPIASPKPSNSRYTSNSKEYEAWIKNTVKVNTSQQNSLKRTEQKPVHQQVFTSHAAKAAEAAGGGKPKKSYRLYTDKHTKQSYIRRSNTKWYLSEHRGKYKYTNKDRTHIYILGTKA